MTAELPKPPIGSGALGPRAGILGLSLGKPKIKQRKKYKDDKQGSPPRLRTDPKPKVPRDIPGRKAVVKYSQQFSSAPIDSAVEQAPVIIELTAKGVQSIPVVTYDLFEADK